MKHLSFPHSFLNRIIYFGTQEYICWSLTHLLDSTLSGEDILDFENVYFVIKTANKQITLSILSQKIKLLQDEMAAIARLAKMSRLPSK